MESTVEMMEKSNRDLEGVLPSSKQSERDSAEAATEVKIFSPSSAVKVKNRT